MVFGNIRVIQANFGRQFSPAIPTASKEEEKMLRKFVIHICQNLLAIFNVFFRSYGYNFYARKLKYLIVDSRTKTYAPHNVKRASGFHIQILFEFLGTFRKLGKATIKFVMFVRPAA